MRFGIIADPIFMEHENPSGHPERPDRVRVLLPLIESIQQRPEVLRSLPVQADPGIVTRVHQPDYFRRIQETSGRTRTRLDPDTHTCERSYEVALYAVGSAIRLVELIGTGEIDSGFLIARPPGHHAESDRAMGFCLFNNVAIAAQWALDQKIARRVAIVDFDVHHGNGTQEIFYHREDVLYVSSHQYPFYPGTGSIRERGSGAGSGKTVNFPLSKGCDDEFYSTLYVKFVRPILLEYAPDLILVSAGYDAHLRDPLGGMRLSAQGFERLTAIVNGVATEVSSGRIVYCLEGGYDLDGLSSSVVRTIECCLSGQSSQDETAPVPEFEEYAGWVRGELAEDWKCLKP